MTITGIRLRNWKNFRDADLSFQQRVFIVGPNASGKSNLLDAIRFLRDIADPEGGFQRAVSLRGGVSQIRCLHARAHPNILIEVRIQNESNKWKYVLEFNQVKKKPVIEREAAFLNGVQVLDRPDADDRADKSRLSQTHLEQVNANSQFRPIADLMSQVRYLHVVPQLIRDSNRVAVRIGDPYGSDFLEQIAKTPKRTLESRLRKINTVLKVAVPQLRELKLEPDLRGVPHLLGLYEHWRPKAGWQSEEQFSDGTLRLIGLLWAFLEGTAPLLLEEPELSLHAAVVRHIPAMMARASRKSQRQILINTHSAELLSDPGIAPEEVVMLDPTAEGTCATLSTSVEDVQTLMSHGTSIGEVVLSRTAPKSAQQLALFGD